jgi:hypothetical protein
MGGFIEITELYSGSKTLIRKSLITRVSYDERIECTILEFLKGDSICAVDDYEAVKQMICYG